MPMLCPSLAIQNAPNEGSGQTADLNLRWERMFEGIFCVTVQFLNGSDCFNNCNDGKS